MSITLLNTASYTNVAGGADFFDKFRTFAVTTCGWTDVNTQTDKYWGNTGGGVYGWINTTPALWEDYLAISSVGYGAQTMRFEFRRRPFDATRDRFYICPINPNFTAISTASSTHPVKQTNRCWQVSVGDDYTEANMPNVGYGNYTACHFFGNSKFIAVINQYTTGVNVIWGIGTPELYPELQSRTDLWQHWYCHQHSADTANYWWDVISTNTTYWWNGLAHLSSDAGNGYNVWLENDKRLNDHVRYSIGTDKNTEPEGAFENLKYLVKFNGFSNKRTIIQPRVYYKTVGGTFWPAGTMPFGYTTFSGLAIGEEIDVGGETFKVFPTLLGSYNYGLAFRVA